MPMAAATVHASAVLVGARAVLIRGPSGAGKSRLALELIQAACAGALPFARLVGDDRVRLQEAGGRLLVRPAEALAGLLEVRGVGILRLPYEPSAVIGLVVDLAADGHRWPEAAQRQIEIDRIRLPRLGVAAGEAALPTVLALLTSSRQCNTHMNVPMWHQNTCCEAATPAARDLAGD
jgi:serine kinase of HPr protein (carbohydrate metabolism regulator)